MLPFRIAILCLLICVPGRDSLPAVSSIVVEVFVQFFVGMDVEEDEQFTLDDSRPEAGLPAIEEEEDPDSDDSEEVITDCRHPRIGEIHAGNHSQLADFSRLMLSFDESFVTFQPLRV